MKAAKTCNVLTSAYPITARTMLSRTSSLNPSGFAAMLAMSHAMKAQKPKPSTNEAAANKRALRWRGLMPFFRASATVAWARSKTSRTYAKREAACSLTLAGKRCTCGTSGFLRKGCEHFSEHDTTAVRDGSPKVSGCNLTVLNASFARLPPWGASCLVAMCILAPL